MENLKVFNNEEFGQVRIIEMNNEIYFVGKDVAEALGYQEPRSAVSKKVDEVDRGVAKMDTPSGIQEMSVINESGLYSLILGSKLESAKKFKRWVTSEVLPSIRKTGNYSELSTELQAVIVVDKRVTNVENRIGKLENNMTVDHEQAQTIKHRVNKVIVELLGGKESNAYKNSSLRGKAYSKFNRDYCDFFRINARANTLASKIDEALRYIDMWQPDTNLRIKIQDCNAQMNMEVA